VRLRIESLSRYSRLCLRRTAKVPLQRVVAVLRDGPRSGWFLAGVRSPRRRVLAARTRRSPLVRTVAPRAQPPGPCAA